MEDMVMTKSRFNLLLLVALVALVGVGCVTTKKFETGMAEMTTRVDGVQTKVEQQSARIDKLDQRDNELASGIQKVDGEVGQVRGQTEQAMTKASAAEKAARGKVLWQVTLTNNDVRFASAKFEITDSGKAVLDQLVDKLKAMDRMVFVEVQGHTDDRGSDQYNQVLGMKRAEAVRDYMHDKGFPLNLMSTISYGESKPIADNKTKDGRATNRRVEVLVLE
jgi:outer membrane protein OmpA-like peptidoglycan-associated protein